METAAGKTERIVTMQAAEIMYEAIKGVGMIGGYLQNILTDTMYYAGKYVAYVRSVCSSNKGAPAEGKSEEGKITVMSLVRGSSDIGDADQQEFYLNFGRDMMEMTKSGLESENLTIIDLSRYKL